MEHLTIGQRIAACRKNLGLSQEALGEKVGVSRQAISKWEADGAVPEIDKLIALSRLFHVSVGWLLGVEEAEAPVEEKAEVSEELLRKIEEIVLRYQPRKPTLSKRKKVLIGIAAALTLLVGVSLLSRWGQLQLDVATVSAQIRNNNEQNAKIMEKLSGLEAQMAEPESSLLSSYQFNVVPIHIESNADTSDAEVYFSAVPSLWKEGDTGTLSIRHNDKGTLQRECCWDGSFLTAMIPLGSDYGYELCFTIRHVDGTQEQQILHDRAVENLRASLSVPVTIRRGGGTFALDGPDLKLTLKGYSVSVERPAIAQESDTWDTIEFVLYLHRDGKQEIIGTYDLLDPVGEGDDILRAAGIETNSDSPVFILPGALEGDGLVLWVNVQMSNGMHTFTIVDQWNYSDGAFNNLEDTYEYH